MGWIDLRPATKNSGADFTAAATASVRLRRNGAVSLYLVFRPALIDEPPPFLARGERVRVRLGTGEHAGTLRIEPGGPFRVLVTSGRSKWPMLSLPLPNLPAKTVKPAACEFGHAPGWFEVTLPWPPDPAAKPKPNGACTGIMERAVPGRPPHSRAPL